MLFIRHRKSLDPFYDEYAEVYYVDGTYVTSVVAFLIFAAVAIQMALRSYDAVICAVCCRSGNSDYYAVTSHKKEIYVFLCAFNAYNACNTDYRYNRLYLSHNGFR